jgi:hypothetical protein
MSVPEAVLMLRRAQFSERMRYYRTRRRIARMIAGL